MFNLQKLTEIVSFETVLWTGLTLWKVPSLRINDQGRATFLVTVGGEIFLARSSATIACRQADIKMACSLTTVTHCSLRKEI